MHWQPTILSLRYSDHMHWRAFSFTNTASRSNMGWQANSWLFRNEFGCPIEWHLSHVHCFSIIADGKWLANMRLTVFWAHICCSDMTLHWLMSDVTLRSTNLNSFWVALVNSSMPFVTKSISQFLTFIRNKLSFLLSMFMSSQLSWFRFWRFVEFLLRHWQTNSEKFKTRKKTNFFIWNLSNQYDSKTKLF